MITSRGSRERPVHLPQIRQFFRRTFPGYRIFLYLLAVCISVIIILFAFGMAGDNTNSRRYQDSGMSGWMNTPLTDITSKKTITAGELAQSGRMVIIHTFALWCPACTAQLGETTRLQYDFPGEYIMLAIDVDPRDSEEKVLEHAQTYAFEGFFCLAPASLSREMIRDLGTGVTLSLPQTIIIKNGHIQYLGSGIFREPDLREKLSSGEN